MNYDPRFQHWSTNKNTTMLISDMSDSHVINTILREYRNWIEQLDNCTGLSDFLDVYQSCPFHNIHIASLVYDLEVRQRNQIP